jgi:hypothetical protein
VGQGKPWKPLGSTRKNRKKSFTLFMDNGGLYECLVLQV